MIEFLFLDLDDTILDFRRHERVAIAKTFKELGLAPTEQVMERYHHINQAHWKLLEQGKLTRQQVLVQRFDVLFHEFGVRADSQECARAYAANLSQGHYFLPGAQETVAALSKKYRLFLASNGTASVQAGRLTSAKLYPYFEKVFISQELGFNKPAPEFFQKAFAQIPDFCKDAALMVGDSLSSDTQGGINAGMRTCWDNPSHAPAGDVRPDHEIESITQLPTLLETL